MHILELELLTNDINSTVFFYNQVLGLPIIFKNEFKVTFNAGATKLTFRLSENLNPVYHLAFDIPKNKLSEAFAWIENKVEILEVIPPNKIADFYNWNAKSFYFLDPNGNILEFIARFDLENESEKSFNGTSILSISEIGFVSKNIVKLSKELLDKYGLTAYSKQPKLEKFIVLGTTTGLFILVDENRNWYPTTIKSKSFWTKVVFELNGKTNQIEFIE